MIGLLGGVAAAIGFAGGPSPDEPRPASLPREFEPVVRSHAESDAQRFQDEVLRELAARSRAASETVPPRTRDRTPATPQTVEATTDPALAELRSRANPAYLKDVFEGRVSGIPNERKAGISIREMTQLGNVPYVEQLRREGRIAELEELGVGPRPAPTVVGEDTPQEPGSGDEIRRYPLNPRLEHVL